MRRFLARHLFLSELQRQGQKESCGKQATAVTVRLRASIIPDLAEDRRLGHFHMQGMHFQQFKCGSAKIVGKLACTASKFCNEQSFVAQSERKGNLKNSRYSVTLAYPFEAASSCTVLCTSLRAALQ